MRLSDFITGLCSFINDEMGCDNCPYAKECSFEWIGEVEEHNFEIESLGD